VVAGDVTADSVRHLVRSYFGSIPRGPSITRPTPPRFALPRDTAETLEDRVQLPRLYYTWHTVNRRHPDAAPLQLLAYILSGAKNGRLTKPMVYDKQIATEVTIYAHHRRLDGDFTIQTTARPGKALPELQGFVDEELARIARSGPTARELQQAKNATEATFLARLEQVSEKAEQMNQYLYYQGEADYFQKDLKRHLAVTAADVRRVAAQYLTAPKVILSIVPEGKQNLEARRLARP
jgi:zinc protease